MGKDFRHFIRLPKNVIQFPKQRREVNNTPTIHNLLMQPFPEDPGNPC
ncbi:hypothetical protein CORMATOL_02799 [Corynebacterium matruchotii ATCC 33806]|uniref:Uncharacterized protein n=1 Tax=Corynebacterium matruchotii ATCC 33806 TaxID=566549 RepID=C0E711_9CORY|nr:hypothetical protein CORMATOL_02799 [Corynebacterium matruchotii ATCC 33806]